MRLNILNNVGKGVRLTEWKIFLSFLVIYATFANYISWNEDSRLDLARAIIDNRTIYIDSFYRNTGDRSYFNGHYYTDKAPGSSLVAIPIYLAYRQAFGPIPPETEFITSNNMAQSYAFLIFLTVFLTSATMTAVVCVLLYRLIGYYTPSKRLRLTIVVAYGVGTIAFFGATVYTGETIASFLVFSSFYLIFNAIYKKGGNLLLAGFLSGFSILTCLHMIVPVALMFCLLLKKVGIKKTRTFLMGLTPPVLLLMLYNLTAFGHPLNFGYIVPDPDIMGGLFIDQNDYVTDGKFKTLSAVWVHLRHFSPNILLRTLIYPYRGFFFYSPILLLSLYGLLLLYRKDKTLSIFITSYICIEFIALSMIRSWWGGSSFGYRYSLPFIPFLMVPLLFAIRKLPNKLVALFIILSIGINLSGMQQPIQSYISVDPARKPVFALEPEFYERFNSWRPIANPLFEYYIPRTLEDGPRSFLLEKVIGRPFARYENVFFLSVLLFIVWGREIRRGLHSAYSVY